MPQASIISLIANGSSALALVAIAVYVVRARVMRPDVICPFYAYPIAASITLLAATYAIRAGAALTRVGLYALVLDALTATSLAICVVYVRELLMEVAEMPNPQHARAANRELARAVTQLTEGSEGSNE